MPLKLMFITNIPEVATIAQDSGVDRIFVDMEYIGKSERQGGMDTVQSRHTFDDIKKVKSVLSKSKCIVRCNPIHDACNDYSSSEEEIEEIIKCGADLIMLPYFKTTEEVSRFLKAVHARIKTMLLVETPEATEKIDDILSLPGIDEVHIGLNDLSLGYNKKFMFELLSDGTVENLCNKFRSKNLVYGFGGIAALGRGMLPAEKIIAEHYRLGSTCAILSRSFCNVPSFNSLDEIKNIFEKGVYEIRKFEEKCFDNEFLLRNKIETDEIISKIVKGFER